MFTYSFMITAQLPAKKKKKMMITAQQAQENDQETTEARLRIS